MPVPAPTVDHGDIAVPEVTRGGWIDALLVAVGSSCIASGWAPVGIPLIVLGIATPAVRWSARRRDPELGLRPLVPTEVADGHAAVLAAASLPGVVDATGAIDAAGDMLLEVAAALVGRPPRGAAQRRLVASRVHAMSEMSIDLRERHETWTTASAEVDAITTGVLPEAPEPPAARDGVLVGLLLVVLTPGFLAWDLARGIARGLVGLRDGLALRVRLAGRLLMAAATGLVDDLRRAARSWRALRDRLVAAAAEARHRFVAQRLRLRIRLRLRRRGIRRPDGSAQVASGRGGRA
jgi:hypothetical protein